MESLTNEGDSDLALIFSLTELQNIKCCLYITECERNHLCSTTVSL
jgi:hypothetical protein